MMFFMLEKMDQRQYGNNTIKKLIYNHYELDVNNLKKLNGYDTENFLVHCKTNHHILKNILFQ